MVSKLRGGGGGVRAISLVQSQGSQLSLFVCQIHITQLLLSRMLKFSAGNRDVIGVPNSHYTTTTFQNADKYLAA